MTNPIRDELARAICVGLGDDPDREGPWLEWVNESSYAAIAEPLLAFIDQHYIPRASLESEEMVGRVAIALCHACGSDWQIEKLAVRKALLSDARAVLAAIGEKP